VPYLTVAELPREELLDVANGRWTSLVAGLAPSDPRTVQLNQTLTDHYNSAKAINGVTAKVALQSTFTVACMAPTATAVGL